MSQMDIINIVTQLGGVLTVVFTAVWWLSTRLERLASKVENHARLMEERFMHLDKEMSGFSRALDDARSGRVELWTEVNQLRERVAVADSRTKDC